MKTRDGLLILRDFDKDILTRKPDRYMVAELERLCRIEDPTYNGPPPPENPYYDVTAQPGKGSPKKRRRGKQHKQTESPPDIIAFEFPDPDYIVEVATPGKGSPKKKRKDAAVAAAAAARI